MAPALLVPLFGSKFQPYFDCPPPALTAPQALKEKTSTSLIPATATGAAKSSSTPASKSGSSWHVFHDVIKTSKESAITQTKKLSPVSNMRQYLNKMLVWSRPDPDPSHWPAYQDYITRDYDPNRWEAFPA